MEVGWARMGLEGALTTPFCIGLSLPRQWGNKLVRIKDALTASTTIINDIFC
jgi:hypothetical protein